VARRTGAKEEGCTFWEEEEEEDEKETDPQKIQVLAPPQHLQQKRLNLYEYDQEELSRQNHHFLQLLPSVDSTTLILQRDPLRRRQLVQLDVLLSTFLAPPPTTKQLPPLPQPNSLSYLQRLLVTPTAFLQPSAPPPRNNQPSAPRPQQPELSSLASKLPYPHLIDPHPLLNINNNKLLLAHLPLPPVNISTNLSPPLASQRRRRVRKVVRPFETDSRNS